MSEKSALTEEQFQAIGRAVADPRRYAILEQVASRTGIACSSLKEHELITAATISHHISELTKAGLITVERDGRTSTLFFCRPVWKIYCKRLKNL